MKKLFFQGKSGKYSSYLSEIGSRLVRNGKHFRGLLKKKFIEKVWDATLGIFLKWTVGLSMGGIGALEGVTGALSGLEELMEMGK